jgi:hypothetical protein
LEPLILEGETVRRSSRKPSILSEALHRRLDAYAVAASAAGVSVLALIPPLEYAVPAGAILACALVSSESAEAKIVYTPVKLHLPCTSEGSGNGLYKLDLNRDKVADFNLYCHGNSGDGGGVSIRAVNSRNKIWIASTSQRRGWAAALPSGVAVKPDKNFQTGFHRMMRWETGGDTFSISGPWVDVKNRYLGLKFLIKGKPHFGWARLHVWFRPNFTHATLTGYAYETIPGKPIITGKTKGPDVITVRDPSLGHLAAGASAIPAWRAREAK